MIYYNRTRLLHMHTQAHRRAFFLSYIFQRLNTSREDFKQQPGQMYYYLGAVTDVTANPNTLNGSAVYFDNNVCYANWYRTLLFNYTLALFGPRAYRCVATPIRMRAVLSSNLIYCMYEYNC